MPEKAPCRPEKKHNLVTRIWHWLNAVTIIILFMSGLNIFNAHPRLYWGEYGFDPADAWFITSRFSHWMTIPGYYSLADARLWHLLFAWVFTIGLTIYLAVSLVNRHLYRDIHISRKEWRPRNLWADVKQHLKLNFSHSDKKYNSLQKISYAGVIFVLIPLMIFTGISMSPAMNANWPWLVDLFGGRQSARSIHFIVAWLLVAFFFVHVALVLLSGPVKQISDMIFGGRSDDGVGK